MAHNLNFNEQTGKHSFFSYCYVKLYITVTGYFQNVRTYKNEEAKLKSLLFGGTGQLLTQRAFQLWEQIAKVRNAGILQLGGKTGASNKTCSLPFRIFKAMNQPRLQAWLVGVSKF